MTISHELKRGPNDAVNIDIGPSLILGQCYHGCGQLVIYASHRNFPDTQMLELEPVVAKDPAKLPWIGHVLLANGTYYSVLPRSAKRYRGARLYRGHTPYCPVAAAKYGWQVRPWDAQVFTPTGSRKRQRRR